ncbi:MAG: PH domain-containing protein [Clostridia bacterium]|nr:PH domain-containing protein [Clostridia bacterium]
MKLGFETIWSDRKRILGMPISFTHYYLSEDRLFHQKGVFTMRMEEILLYRISDVSIKVNLWQRIFGVGSILVHSSDKTTPHLELKNVKDPFVVKELIHKKVEEMKISRNVRVSEFLDDGPNGVRCR